MTKFLEKNSTIVVSLAFFIIGLLAYWSVLTNGFILDDHFSLDYVSKISFTELWKLFDVYLSFVVRPLPLFSFWIQHRLFGENIVVAHLVNVGFHAGNATILFWFLHRLGTTRITAFFAGLLFLLTPIAPEVVTWPGARFDAMTGFFILLCLSFYLSFLQNRRLIVYLGAIAAAILAILSKENALVLLVLVPLLLLLFEEKDKFLFSAGAIRKNLKKNLLWYLPLLTVFVIFFGYRQFIVEVEHYSPLLATPKLAAIKTTFKSLLAPVNFETIVFPGARLLGIYTTFLLLISLLLVIINWRRVSVAVRKIWIFFAVFLAVSFVPVYWAVFVNGVGSNLHGSRHLYITTISFLALLTISMSEFAGDGRRWRIFVISSLSLLALLFFPTLQNNNDAWKLTAEYMNYIPDEAKNLLPDPPENSHLYFEFEDKLTETGHLLNGALEGLIQIKYGRPDLTVTNLAPGEKIDESGGYHFVYRNDMLELMNDSE